MLCKVFPVFVPHAARKDRSLRSRKTSYPRTHECIHVTATESSTKTEQVEAEAVRNVVCLTAGSLPRCEIRYSVSKSLQETKSFQTRQQRRVRVGGPSQVDCITRLSIPINYVDRRILGSKIRPPKEEALQSIWSYLFSYGLRDRYFLIRLYNYHKLIAYSKDYP
jgi:hypothetical protein